MAVTLADALTDFALLAVEGQQALHDEAGETEWEADLDQCRLWLGERPYDIAMIGTSSEISNTWMWSWANPGYGASHPAVSAILPGCAKGREAGIPEFAVESFSLEGVTDYGMRPGSAVAFLAARLSGAPAMYAAPYGSGVAYLAIFNLELPAPTPETLPRMMSACLEYSRNHRQTIGNFGAQRGLRPARTNDGGIVLTYPKGTRVHCAFDDWSRVTRVRMEQFEQA
jgi:hypothetical protein